MGIERGHGAAGSAAAAHAPATAGKSAAQAAAGGDFLALMAALDEGAGLGEALLPGAEPAAEAAAADTGTGTERAAELPVAGWPWPAVPTASPPAAQTTQAAVGPSVVAPAGQPAAGALPGTAPQAGAAGEGLAGAAASAQSHASAQSPSAAPPAAPPNGPPAAPAAAPPELAAVFEQLRHRLAAQEAAPREPAAAATAANAAVAAPAAVRDIARAERAGPTAIAPMVRGETVSLQAQAVAAVAAGQGSAPSGDAPSDGAGAGTGHAPGHGAWVQDFTPTVQYDAALGAGDPVAPADTPDPEALLADQLRHWAASGPRSAELTLGGSDPVQLRIDLDGTEAQVQFRSEHAATRELLAGTVDQLRDLLSAQGLTLASVSVGAQGSGTGREPQDQAQPQTQAGSAAAPRQGTPDAGRAAIPAPAAHRGAGALDLYV